MSIHSPTRREITVMSFAAQDGSRWLLLHRRTTKARLIDNNTIDDSGDIGILCHIQNPSQPCSTCQTARELRKLKSNWTSIPSESSWPCKDTTEICIFKVWNCNLNVCDTECSLLSRGQHRLFKTGFTTGSLWVSSFGVWSLHCLICFRCFRSQVLKTTGCLVDPGYTQ